MGIYITKPEPQIDKILSQKCVILINLRKGISMVFIIYDILYDIRTHSIHSHLAVNKINVLILKYTFKSKRLICI